MTNFTGCEGEFIYKKEYWFCNCKIVAGKSDKIFLIDNQESIVLFFSMITFFK